MTGKHTGRSNVSAWQALIRAAAHSGARMPFHVDRDGRINARGTGQRGLARTIAQGIAFTRILRLKIEQPSIQNPSATDVADADIREDLRGPLEAAAIAWRDLHDSADQAAIRQLVPVPNEDPVIAMRISPERIAEFDALGDGPAPHAVDEANVWYLELDEPAGVQPDGLLRIRVSDPAGGEPGTRVCAIWTRPPHGSFDRPLIVTMQWQQGQKEARIGSLQWPLPIDGEMESRFDRDAVARTLVEHLRTAWIPVILHRAIDNWAHAARTGRTSAATGFRQRVGTRLRYRDKDDLQGFLQRLANEALLDLPPCPPGPEIVAGKLPTAATGLDAVLLTAARATDRLARGAQPGSVNLWSEKWWARAEQGLLMWNMQLAPPQPGDPQVGHIRAVGGDLGNIVNRPGPPAMRCLTELASKALTQTGRAEVVHSAAPGTIHGLKVPPRLWRATAEAGPHPDPADIHADGQWWYVEIEEPAGDEPDAVAMWPAPKGRRQPGGTLVSSGLAIWTRPTHTPRDTPFIGAWRQFEDRGMLGWARLDWPAPFAPGVPGVRLPEEIEDRYETMIQKLVGADHGVLQRVHAAITEHLTRGTSEPLALTPHWQDHDTKPNDSDTAPEPDATNTWEHSIFALVRAPDPVVADPDADHRSGNTPPPGSHTLDHRHYVSAHWRRQPHGPKNSLRRLVCVEGYWRGPDPGTDHLPLVRPADRGPEATT